MARRAFAPFGSATKRSHLAPATSVRAFSSTHSARAQWLSASPSTSSSTLRRTVRLRILLYACASGQYPRPDGLANRLQIGCWDCCGRIAAARIVLGSVDARRASVAVAGFEQLAMAPHHEGVARC